MSDADHTRVVEYRSIPKFPGYRVGNDGSVWSLNKPGHSGWYKLKHWVEKDGYHSVRLKNRSGYWSVRVHRLVLSFFVGPCPDGMVAAHGNGVRSDNRLVNLRWDTQKGNVADKVEHGTAQRGERHGMAILSDDDVHRAFAMASEGLTRSEIAAVLCVKKVTIQKVLSRAHWSHIKTAAARQSSQLHQVELITRALVSGMSTLEIASQAGVSRAMINAVLRKDRTMRLRHELALERIALTPAPIDLLFRPGA